MILSLAITELANPLLLFSFFLIPELVLAVKKSFARVISNKLVCLVNNLNPIS
jgi:hypothetical protein